MGTPMAPYYWIESRNRNMMMGEHLAHHFPNFLATYLIFQDQDQDLSNMIRHCQI